MVTISDDGRGTMARARVKVLMVDDEPDVSLLIRQRFRSRIRAGDLEFVFASNGLEALQRFQQDGDIDIVITDINMPVMDGLTLLEHLRHFARIHKSVIISAYDDLGNIRTAMNRGAFDFVTKPIDFADLESTLDRTIDQLLRARKADEESSQLQSLRRELDIASGIQRSILPDALPPLAGPGRLEVEGRMLPAQEVGGDFYDYFVIDADRVGVVIGDVSGKGVAAALFMAVTRTLVKATAQLGTGAQACLQVVNRTLAADNEPTMFVTAFYGIVNRRTGELEFCNAGHTPALVVRDGDVSVLRTETNVMLGVEADFTFVGGRHRLAPGETLVLCTDGVTEAEDAAGELYGSARLETLLRRLPPAAPGRTLAAIVDDVQGFARDARRTDDLTVLALRWLGE